MVADVEVTRGQSTKISNAQIRLVKLITATSQLHQSQISQSNSTLLRHRFIKRVTISVAIGRDSGDFNQHCCISSTNFDDTLPKFGDVIPGR